MKQTLTIQNIHKQYGNKEVLHDVCITLSNGIYGLIGPNGAGKSTLIKILCTLEKQTKGQILYNNQDIKKLKKEYCISIGLMPQTQKGYEQFTAIQFLYYMATLKGMSKQQASEEIHTLLHRVGLQEYQDLKLKAFSGGMRQRLMFIQAMLNDPKIVILDEPTAGLDPFERIRLRNLISELAQDKIVIIATHVMQDVESIAKEIILLKEGNVLFQGSGNTIIHSIAGKIIETLIPPQQLEEYASHYKISKVSRLDDQLLIRYIDEEETTSELHPNLEDVYLYYMV